MRKVSKIQLLTDFKTSDMVLINILRKRDNSTYYFCFLKLATLQLPKNVFASEPQKQHFGHMLADLLVYMCVRLVGMRQDLSYHMGQNPYLPLKLLNIYECFPEEKKKISIIQFPSVDTERKGAQNQRLYYVNFYYNPNIDRHIK